MPVVRVCVFPIFAASTELCPTCFNAYCYDEALFDRCWYRRYDSCVCVCVHARVSDVCFLGCVLFLPHCFYDHQS